MLSTDIYTQLEFEQIFLSKLGDPDNRDSLNEYFDIIFNYQLNENVYSEEHHILPKSIFPDYIIDVKNLIRLDQRTHIKVHTLLAEAYYIKQFTNPLRFMNENISTEIHSLSSKRGWETLKNNKEKYDEWAEKRSKSCTEHMLNGHAKYMVECWLNNPISVAKHKQSCNDSWTTERREKHSKKLKKAKSTIEAKLKISETSKKMWDNKTEEERNNFNAKMKVVNASEEKRKKNSETIKKLWADPTWRAEFLRKREETYKLKNRSNNETK